MPILDARREINKHFGGESNYYPSQLWMGISYKSGLTAGNIINENFPPVEPTDNAYKRIPLNPFKWDIVSATATRTEALYKGSVIFPEIENDWFQGLRPGNRTIFWFLADSETKGEGKVIWVGSFTYPNDSYLNAGSRVCVKAMNIVVNIGGVPRTLGFPVDCGVSIINHTLGISPDIPQGPPVLALMKATNLHEVADYQGYAGPQFLPSLWVEAKRSLTVTKNYTYMGSTRNGAWPSSVFAILDSGMNNIYMHLGTSATSQLQAEYWLTHYAFDNGAQIVSDGAYKII